MILVNPNYIFNHVVFINPDKKFISIETDVYRRVHSIIFKGRHSTPKQRRKLRLLFYETYYSFFFKGEKIDHQVFNNKILDIYRNDSVISFDHTTATEDESGDVVLAGDMPYYVDDAAPTGDEKIWPEDSSVRSSLIRMKDINFDYINDLSESMNSVVVKNEDYRLLVDHLGYGKIVNIFKRFIFSTDFRTYDEYEFYFVFRSLTFLASYRLHFFGRKWGFICEDCKNVDRHFIQGYKELKGTKGVLDSCDKTYWFNRNGIIKNQVHSQHYLDKYSDSMFYEDGKSLVILATRYYLQIGLLHADLSVDKDFETIIIMNNNKVLYDQLKNKIKDEESKISGLNSLRSSFVCSEIIRKQQEKEIELQSFDRLDYSSICTQYYDLFLEYVAEFKKDRVYTPAVFKLNLNQRYDRQY